MKKTVYIIFYIAGTIGFLWFIILLVAPTLAWITGTPFGEAYSIKNNPHLWGLIFTYGGIFLCFGIGAIIKRKLINSEESRPPENEKTEDENILENDKAELLKQFQDENPELYEQYKTLINNQ